MVAIGCCTSTRDPNVHAKFHSRQLSSFCGTRVAAEQQQQQQQDDEEFAN